MDLKAGIGAEGRDALAHALADFDEEPASGRQEASGFWDEAAVDRAGVAGGEEREEGLVVADFRRQGGCVGGIHIRGIADDHVDAAQEGEKRREQVASVPGDACRETETIGVVASHVQSGLGYVDAVDGGLSQLGREGKGDTAASCSDVDNGGALEGTEALQRGLDQDLGLRAGDEDVGGYQELVSPEGLGASEVLQRTSARTFADEGEEERLLLGGQRLARVGEERGAIPAGDVAEQTIGVQVRLGNARFRQPGSGNRQRLEDRHG